MATFQEEYWRAYEQIKELQRAAKRRVFNDETKRTLEENIRTMQRNIEGARDYVIESESLAHQAMELKRQIEHAERCIAELDEIYDKRIEVTELDSLDMLQEKREQDKRIKELLYSVSDSKTRSEIEKISDDRKLRLLYDLAKEENEYSKIDLEMIYNQINVNRTKAIKGIESESEKLLDESDSLMDREESLVPELEEIQDSLTLLNETNRFREIIKGRNERLAKIMDIKGVRLESGKFRADASRMKQLREESKVQENFIKEYIHEFSKNPDYELSEELVALIGERDRKSGTYVRPTVKQHLEPIEEKENQIKAIQKQLDEDKMRAILLMSDDQRKSLANAPHLSKEQKELYQRAETLSEEEKERIRSLEKLPFEENARLEKEKAEAKKEKAEKEKRLGKKWIIKLKIDKLNAEIKTVEAELREAIRRGAPAEEIEQIKSKLATKYSELNLLQKEYGDILNQIGDMMADSVEKATLKKHDVKSVDDLKKKVNPDKSELPVEGDKEKKIESTRSGAGTPIPGISGRTNDIGTSIPTSGAIPSVGGSESISSLSSPKESEKSLTVKKSLKEKISDLFSKKDKKNEKEEDKKAPYEVLQSERLEYDFASQYAMFPHAKVDGKYFYHTIKKDDELLYVREPLENMKCTERDLIKKIKELQKEHSKREIAKDYDDSKRGVFGSIAHFFKDKSREELIGDAQRKKDALIHSNPRAILNKQLGVSVGEERKLRMLKMMCGLEAAHLTQEVIDSFDKGIGKEQFNPGVKMEKKKMVFVENGEMSAEFREMLDTLNRDEFEEEVSATPIVLESPAPAPSESIVDEKEEMKEKPIKEEVTVGPVERERLEEELLTSTELPEGIVEDLGLDDPDLISLVVSDTEKPEDSSRKENNIGADRTSTTLIDTSGRSRGEKSLFNAGGENRRIYEENKTTTGSTRVPRRLEVNSSRSNSENIPPVPVFRRKSSTSKNHEEDVGERS